MDREVDMEVPLQEVIKERSQEQVIAGKGTMKAAIDYTQSKIKIPGVEDIDQLSLRKGYNKIGVKGINRLLKSESTSTAVKNLQSRVAKAATDSIKGKLGGETTNIINKIGFGIYEIFNE